MDDNEIKEQNQFERLIQGLIDDDYGCCNNFTLPNTVIRLRVNIQILNELGKMKPSEIGNNTCFN